MAQTTAEQRENWQEFKCKESAMVRISFGPARIRVAPPTVEAWEALASVFAAHDYQIRAEETGGYNCRQIKGGGGLSLHSFGIAVDVNTDTNPWRKLAASRDVRFSSKPTQAERANDVRLNRADTDMTPELIADILAICTNAGRKVFEWGGGWSRIKDAMHFELDLSPTELASGIDWRTVRGSTRSVQEQPVFVDTDGDGLPDTVTTLPAEIGMVADLTGPISFGDQTTAVTVLQKALTYLGYPLGEADGIFGTLTREAVFAFQLDNDLPPTGVADQQTLSAFARVRRRPLPYKRVATDAAALRAEGSRTITAADNTKIAGLVASCLGILGLGNSAFVELVNGRQGKGPTPADVDAFLTNTLASLNTGLTAKDRTDLLQKAGELFKNSMQSELTPETIRLLKVLQQALPESVVKTQAVSQFFDQVKAADHPYVPNIVGAATTWLPDGIADVLTTAASSILPGAGGSLAALGIGLAANFFANNVIGSRVRDHETGLNANR